MCKEDSLSLFITVDVAWKMLKAFAMEINTHGQNVKVHFSIEVVVEYNGQFFVGRVVDEPGTL